MGYSTVYIKRHTCVIFYIHIYYIDDIDHCSLKNLNYNAIILNAVTPQDLVWNRKVKQKHSLRNKWISIQYFWARNEFCEGCLYLLLHYFLVFISWLASSWQTCNTVHMIYFPWEEFTMIYFWETLLVNC